MISSEVSRSDNFLNKIFIRIAYNMILIDFNFINRFYEGGSEEL